MTKNEAVAFLKERGWDISVFTLDRHRKDGRIVATDILSKTGLAKDYSEEALLAYLEAEKNRAPGLVTAIAKPSQEEAVAQPSQGLATVPFQAIQGEIQTIEVVDTPLQDIAKALLEVHQVGNRSVWTIDEAVAATGVSKGAFKAAVKAKKVRGGLDGGKLKVNAADARRFAAELF